MWRRGAHAASFYERLRVVTTKEPIHMTTCSCLKHPRQDARLLPKTGEAIKMRRKHHHTEVLAPPFPLKSLPFLSSATTLVIASSHMLMSDALPPMADAPMCLACANTGSRRRLRPDMPMHCPASSHRRVLATRDQSSPPNSTLMLLANWRVFGSTSSCGESERRESFSTQLRMKESNF